MDKTDKKYFRMHLTDIQWKDGVTVVLGQNFRGLIAANEIVKVNSLSKSRYNKIILVWYRERCILL